MANTNKHNLSKGHRGEPSSPGLHSTGPPQSGRKIYKNTKKKKNIQIEEGGLQGRRKHKYETFEETLLNTLCVFNQFIFEAEAKQNSLQWFQSEALKGDNK